MFRSYQHAPEGFLKKIRTDGYFIVNRHIGMLNVVSGGVFRDV